MMYVQGCSLKFCNSQRLIENNSNVINKRLAERMTVHSSVLCCRKEQKHCMHRHKKYIQVEKARNKTCILWYMLPFV